MVPRAVLVSLLLMTASAVRLWPWEEDSKLEGASSPSDLEEPSTPGCFFLMPTGCDPRGVNTSALAGESGDGESVHRDNLDRRDSEVQWKRDTYGMKHKKAGLSRAACEEQRREQINLFCQRSDAEMKFVPGTEPTKPAMPGCYVWLPSGCHKRSFHAKTLWRLVEETNRTQCEEDSPLKYNKWCGADDARTLFVSKPPARPVEPGCYVWMPTGCIQHSFASKRTWKRDEVGDDARRAAVSKSACEVERKEHWNKFCGESNARMAFVPESGSQTVSQGEAATHRFE